MQTLLIATRNAHKTREIGQMLGSGWDVRDLASLPHAPNIEETGATFEENAALKALHHFKDLHWTGPRGRFRAGSGCSGWRPGSAFCSLCRTKCQRRRKSIPAHSKTEKS